jgi:uncharacterized DUF497 family protein
VEFEWDLDKEARNLRKHGVTFSEATTVFDDAFGTTVDDPDHSLGEHRFITIGRSSHSRWLMVAHTDRGDRVRIISARELTRSERRAYEETIQI